jgi:hypothetical protein
MHAHQVDEQQGAAGLGKPAYRSRLAARLRQVKKKMSAGSKV